MMLSQEDLVDQDLQRLQDTINEKIDIIQNVLQEEDRSIVQEIVMKKSHSTDPLYPKYDKRSCYYQEFWKVFLFNEIMITKIKQYSQGNKIIVKQVHELEEAQREWSNLWSQKSKKKSRRPSNLIDKTYQCPFEGCFRPYGSDVALNNHMKIKHNAGTKTQRQNLAKEICLAEEKGIKIQVNLCFPSGYLEQFRQNFKKQNCL